MRGVASHRCLLLLSAIALAGACSDAIDVLDREATAPDASRGPLAHTDDAGDERNDDSGGANGSTPRRPDASTPDSNDAGTNSGKPKPADDPEVLATPCDPRCGAEELCAIDRCVDSAGVTQVATSLDHACAVIDGQLFCWGNNESAQLGVGGTQARRLRTRVGTWNDWLRVTASEKESCAIRAPGRLYCLGNNTSGELGLGDTQSREAPAPVDASTRWRDVSCGGDSCCALQDGGALFCWGANLEGKIGQGDQAGSPDVLRPTPVLPDIAWREVAVGQGHVCAISEDGALYCWGRNTDLELGIGSADPIQLRAPTRIGDASDWRSIAGSQHHTCGVREEGSLWCWGSNAFFELGAPAEVMSSAAPRRVGDDDDWLSVRTGWFHTCAAKRDGRLFCWGRAIEGQLGQGMNNEPQQLPGMIAMPERWLGFALGRFDTCGVEQSGSLYCWGVAGALGFDDGERRYVPALVP